MSSAWSASSLLLPLLLATAGCPGDDEPLEPLFPEDYAATYTEVRDCRSGADHDLNNVRVMADPAALGPYTDRVSPFPDDAVLVKEEYDFGDDDCTGAIVQWTVMVRGVAEDAPEGNLGWRWQRVDPDRNVMSADDPRCFDCHSLCGVAPDGYDGTCTVP
jgi:hypothetical protein